MLFQTYRNLFLMLNIKEDILKNASNQRVVVPIDFSFPTMEVNGINNCIFLIISSFVFNVRKKLEGE